MRHLNLIGPQVRKLRSQRGWTQEDLAGALQRAGLDISRSGLAKVESRMILVRDHHLHFFMKALRASLDDLYPPINTDDPNMYDVMNKLMESRF
ncbi:MAG: helix-turn-helix transcriptional regulator [Akkermansiaceae bacterium]|nr:helix-turn-helix transcriptional regulator [Akkermansiaceae bacterium]